MNDTDLIKIAFKAQKNAKATFSHFRVGAAILTCDNQIFSGCNIESSSYGLSVCAERVAVFKAVSEGFIDFKAIAIVSDADELCPPCGACRQVLWDLARDIDIILAQSVNDYRVQKLSSYFPYAFDNTFLDENKQKS